MIAEEEHEIIPTIRGWLAATADIEVPTGLPREEARLQARELLIAISVSGLSPEMFEVGDDLKDVLWGAVEELGERPLGLRTFEECDRFYQFVLGLPTDDLFNERDEILRRTARVGWRSTPNGLEGILTVRAKIWEQGDGTRYREICETADQLPSRVDRLCRQVVPDSAELRDVYARLAGLTNVSPLFVMSLLSRLETVHIEHRVRLGLLDEQEHLKASGGLLAGMVARQLGKWEEAEANYCRAASGFCRTASIADLDRVESERLAVALLRQDTCTVIRSAPLLIDRTPIPRERAKARLLLASALLSANRAQDSLDVLNAVQSDLANQREPTFQAWALTKCGTAYSYLDRGVEAMESFRAAGRLLSEFNNPMQLGDLAASVGEHLVKFGSLEDASILYRRARVVSTRLGQVQQAAYLSVLLAELLMMLGRPDEAEAELIGVLPTIEMFDLRKEAVAAVGLLREAVAKRGADVKTIRAVRDQLEKGLH